MAKAFKDNSNCIGMAERLAIIPEDTMNETALVQALEEAMGEVAKSKRVSDVVLDLVSNSYLSGTMTPIANALSIGVQSLLRPTVYALGSLTDAVGATGGNRSMRDAYAMIQSMSDGLMADLHFFRQGFARGYPLDVQKSIKEMATAQGRKVSEVEQDIVNAFARRRLLNEGYEEGTPDFIARFEELSKRNLTENERSQFVNENYDYMRKAIDGTKGEIIRIPTRLTVALDEYGKARFRRMKLMQMASEKARKEATVNGKLNTAKYLELMEGPPGVPQQGYKYRLGLGQFAETALQRKVLDTTNKQIEAELQAGKITQADVPKRTKELKAELEGQAKSFANLETSVTKMFGTDEKDWVPYQTVREFALDNTFQSRLYGIPAQVMKIKNESNDFSRIMLGTMVPFIKTPWNILKEGVTYVPGLPWVTRPTYSVGGEPVRMTKDELIPRQILGTTMFMGVMSLYASGRATGAPKDANEAQAWKDQGIPPFSIKIGDTWIPYQRIEPIATVMGLAADLKRAVEDYQDNPRPNKALGEGVTDVLVGLKHHIMSKSFMEGFSLVLEGITDPARVDEKILTQVLRPLTPAIVNEGARLLDKYERQALTPLEKTMQRLPVIRESLPKEYGLIGEPRETNMIQAITGFGIVSESERSPLQVELGRLNFTKGRVGDTLKGVNLTNEQTSEYRQLVAELLTPRLEKLIQSPSYQTLSDPRKKVYLEKHVNRIKRAAARRYTVLLRKTDPEMAKLFYNETVIKKGLQEDVQLKQ